MSIGPTPPLEAVAHLICDPIPEGPPDLWKGLLPQREQLVVAGETNIGKSLIALEMCSSLSTGEPLWGHLEPATVSPKTLYLLGEHNALTIRRLWHRTRLKMDRPIYLMGPQELKYDKLLMSRGQINPVAEEKIRRWAEGCGFIVFDPMGAFVSGDGSENDNSQMRELVAAMSRIAEGVGAASLVLAHKGKPRWDATSGRDVARNSYAIRGASSIEDSSPNVFYMNLYKTQSREVKLREAEALRAEEAGPEENLEFDEMPQDVGLAKIFELWNRKLKAEGRRRFRLKRGPNLTHTLLVAAKPTVEVRHQDIYTCYLVCKDQYPQASEANLERMVAEKVGVNVRTVREWKHGVNRVDSGDTAA